MGQVVVPGEVLRGEAQRLLVEADRTGDAPLPPLRGIGRLGLSALEPELFVGREFLQRLVQCRTVGGQLRRVARRVFGRHLQRPRGHVAAIVIGARERLRAHERRSGGRRDVELHVGDRQTEMRQRKPGIDSQRLVEGPRRFDPDVGVQIGQALVVEGLRLRRRSRRGIVRRSDAGADGDGPLRQFERDSGRRRGMRVLGLRRRARRQGQPEHHGDQCAERKRRRDCREPRRHVANLESAIRIRKNPLEVELRADLEEARLEHVGRLQPVAGRRRREGAADGERPVAVEEVIGVEVETEAHLIQLDPLGRPEVELLKVLVAVVRADRLQVDASLSSAPPSRRGPRWSRVAGAVVQVARMLGAAPPVCTPRLNW